MRRIMLDLETLDTGNNAVIISIGAVEFGLEGVTREFYTAVEKEQQVEKWGRTTSGATIKWWSEQSAEARKVLTDPLAKPLPSALMDFRDWLFEPPGGIDEMWGNGADFDNVVLRNAYVAVGQECPWSFWTNRCFRTLKNLGVPLQPGDGIARTTHHNALDDAKVQAYDAAAYLRYIKLGQEKLK